MKKHLILTSFVLFMVTLFTGMTCAQTVDNSTLVGIWQLCDDSGNLVKTGSARVKIITTESFTVAETNQDLKAVSTYFIGSYTLKNKVYTEMITYAASQLQSYVGKVNSFNIELKGDQLYLKGIGNQFNEIWQRISK